MKRKNIKLTYENILYDAELNILRWYNFSENAMILAIGWNNQLIRRLCEECQYMFVETTPSGILEENFAEQHRNTMDYVILMETIEVTEKPALLMQKAYTCLKRDGKLLVIANNKYAIKHFCGDKTPYEERLFDELEGKRAADGSHSFGIGELEQLFRDAKIDHVRKYAVYPHLYNAQKIYSFEYAMRDKVDVNVQPWYTDNSLIYAREAKMYEGLVSSGLFFALANGFFFEAGKGEEQSKALFVTISSGRTAERQFITTVRNDGIVEKRPVYENGMCNLYMLEENHKYLRERGLHVVQGKMNGDCYQMEYIEAPSLLEQMRKAYYNGGGEIITLFDQYVEELRKSSAIIGTGEMGEILQYGFIDMVLLNCFYDNGQFLFFDQEYAFPNLPLKVIIYRSLVIMYDAYPEFDRQLPISFFLDRYGITECIDGIRKIESEFFLELNVENLMVLHRDYHAPFDAAIEANQCALNETSLKRVLKENGLSDLEGGKIILLGANDKARKFLAIYRHTCDVVMVIDENPAKQGTEFEGYTVNAMERLAELRQETTKVIIAVEDVLPAYQRLRRWGINSIGWYEG